jgi:NADPH-dependent glutamate synthase beta subunit-like oxidoreductase
VLIHDTDFELNDASQVEAKERTIKRQLELLRADRVRCVHFTRELLAAEAPAKRLFLHFLKSPVEFVKHPEHQYIASVRLQHNRLDGPPAKQRAVGTSESSALGTATDCTMAINCIGYRAQHLESLPFDHANGVVPNIAGRIVAARSEHTSFLPGLYVSGWLKRGPTGIIGTNIWDASETVVAIAEDAQNQRLHEQHTSKGGVDALELDELRTHTLIDYQAWKRLDHYELERGKAEHKARSKVQDIGEMIRIAIGNT